MKKIIKITIALAIIALLFVLIGALVSKNRENSNQNVSLDEQTNTTQDTGLNILSAGDLTSLVERLYEDNTELFSSLFTQEIDISDSDIVKSYTGLENGNDLEFMIASEPMMSSQAYSLVLVKVKDGVDIESIAKSMNENVDARKWICVSAEKVYTTSSGNIICLVMSSEEMAKPVYEKFKTLAGTIGQEYERVGEEEIELPPDMY